SYTTTHRQDAEELYMHHQDTQINIESEARYSREAWAHSEHIRQALEAPFETLEAQFRTL
ncbi:hypothetical protein Tco_1484629, partial [Tanacetum coccineum]